MSKQSYIFNEQILHNLLHKYFHSRTHSMSLICHLIQKAKKKPIAKKSAADFGVDLTPRQETISVEDPPTREAGQKVESVDELITKLKESGCV